MPLQPNRSKSVSPYKKNENEPNTQNQEEGESSQNAQENKKKIKQKKRGGKQKSSQNLNLSAPPCIIARNLPRRNVCRSLSMLPVVPTTYLPIAPMRTYYPRYSSPASYPVAVNDWNSMMTTVPIHSPMYNIPYQPIPVTIFNPTQMLASPYCPYTTMVPPPPMYAPMMPPVAVEDTPSTSTYVCESAAHFSPEQIVPTTDTTVEVPYQPHEGDNVSTDTTLYEARPQHYSDPLDYFLSLPKNLFPAARTFALDPNPVIDEFCKTGNIQSNVPWILDLEFGLPRVPINRTIPVFDISFNSIHCRNAPDRIHPGFQSCNQEFKQMLMYYYNYIISSWFTGYTNFTCDDSLENFQKWVLFPMQILGMCWP